MEKCVQAAEERETKQHCHGDKDANEFGVKNRFSHTGDIDEGSHKSEGDGEKQYTFCLK